MELKSRADGQLDWLQFLQLVSRGQSLSQRCAERRHAVCLVGGGGLQMVVRASRNWAVERQMSHGGEERTACVHRGQQVRKRAVWRVFGSKTLGEQKVLEIEKNRKNLL